MQTFDLTPDPKVYIALTHTPMQPLDALCELIDNAIDSFQTAKLMGYPVQDPLIAINLPRPADLSRGEGTLRIRDNGPGLNAEMAERAIKAGFSGNNPYDSLGLFGMGFNISTGKLGRVTRLFTVRQDVSKAIEVIIDLEKLRESGSFKIPFEEVEKEQGFNHGTLVEVNQWWPEGNPNSGFIKKLVQYGMPTVRKEIGRRYATILRGQEIRISINEEYCKPFEHCRWAETRTVQRQGHGIIPAVFSFDESVGSQKRCSNCTALIFPGQEKCLGCGSSSFRTIEERIKGWVGIQRFDHETDFGIDLIRNGRAIRIGEKSAFFEFVDEFKRMIKDYPIDGPFGRIIGEVHVNHVPVDFLKQDFQRSSPEWQRAMSFLRGDTPLQPGKIKAGETNDSPVYKLFQGYRRVRTPGKSDMYMGYWDNERNEPKRISRDKEKEFYEKFEAKEPGYYDDSEWWKLVEQADQKPVEELIECPECGGQNLKGHDICKLCYFILISKTCINGECLQVIPQSAVNCPHCGFSQVPEVQEPWVCQLCRTSNSPSNDICKNCGSSRGAPNPLSEEFLLENSNKADNLSIPGCSIQLANGNYSTPIDVDTFVTKEAILAPLTGKHIPLIVFKSDRLNVFIDKAHPVFKLYRIRPEQMIAAEVALYIYDLNRSLSGQQYLGQHTLSNIEWDILSKRWTNELEDSVERVQTEIQVLFNNLRDALPNILNEGAGDYFDYLEDDQKKRLLANMLDQGIDIADFEKMKNSGQYLRYVDPQTVVSIFRKVPGNFFDNVFWKEAYNTFTGLPDIFIQEAQQRLQAIYSDCLEDIARFLNYNDPDQIVVQRARASLEYLLQRIA